MEEGGDPRVQNLKIRRTFFGPSVDPWEGGHINNITLRTDQQLYGSATEFILPDKNEIQDNITRLIWIPGQYYMMNMKSASFLADECES